MNSVNMTYPDGTVYPLQVGQLALGASVANQSFSGGDEPAINATLLPNYLESHKYIPTASYGMHIGSAALNLPLSLWLGGYDMARVLGPVSAQPYSANIQNNNFFIDLFDIGIGVDHGGSPWSYHTKNDLLAQGNKSISSLSVAMNSAAPYIYLPNSTCAALTKDLPVTYSAKYGLYLWEVTNPQYIKIITAPTYLIFIFRNAGQNITVKVPFQLLNLTLDSPLIDKPTQYFPCTTPQDSSTYTLGRAFLQAAFIGVNWDQGLGQWFLAQAPGPNTDNTPSQTPINGTILKGSGADWAQSWSSVWTALPVASSNSSPTATAIAPPQSSNPSPKSHLTSGASAGLGVGIALILLGSVVGVAALYFRRRKRRREEARSKQSEVLAPPGYEEFRKDHLKTVPSLYEAPAFADPQELGSSPNLAHELEVDMRKELPALPGHGRRRATENFFLI